MSWIGECINSETVHPNEAFFKFWTQALFSESVRKTSQRVMDLTICMPNVQFISKRGKQRIKVSDWPEAAPPESLFVSANYTLFGEIVDFVRFWYRKLCNR
jgi:hypothetical protein